MKMKISFFMILFLFAGCVGLQVDKRGVSSKEISKKNVMDIVLNDNNNKNQKDNELYFSDTRGKIFYKNSSSDILAFQLNSLLHNIFQEAKSRLPKKGRRKKINVAIEIDNQSIQKDKILNISERYILSNKHFSLVSSDDEILKVLKKVLKKEKDGLYKHNMNISSKNSSDVILYIKVTKNKNTIDIIAKLISKNGTILATKQKKIDKNQKWVEVKVPTNNGQYKLFKVMRYPVTLDKKKSIQDLSYKKAENFCLTKMGGELITIYVFEAARKSLAIEKPKGFIDSEILAPFDEEDDEMYQINDDDHLFDETNEESSNIVMFNWNNEKYFSVPNVYKSQTATFRCMKKE